LQEERQKEVSTGEIGKAYTAAFADIRHAMKNSENPHFKSSYANLEEVINVIRDCYSKHGLAIVQFPGALLRDGDMVRVEIQTSIIHSSGEMLGATMHMPVSLDKNGRISAHAVGSAISFGRRYAYAAAAGITQSDDDGNAASTGEEDEPAADLGALRAQIEGAKTEVALKALRQLVLDAGDQPLADTYKAKLRKLK
jgi:hypothetical protein